MFFVVLTVSCIFFGPSAGVVYNRELCYGDNLKMPEDHIPPLFNGSLYITPDREEMGERRLIMDNGKPKDPRLTVSSDSVYLQDVTHWDEGFFSISAHGSSTLHKIVTLKILDCADRIKKYHGDVFNLRIPSQAKSLEFRAQLNPYQQRTLWYLNAPQVHENEGMTLNGDDLEIPHVTQENSGHYNFRTADRTVLTRLFLTVQENTRRHEAQVKQSVHISYPWVGGTWTVTFTPEGEGNPQTVMKAGKLVLNNDWFLGRLQTSDSGIEIDPIEDNDSGIFEFRDPEGNLALKAELKVVEESNPTLKYFVIITIIVLLVGVCCYKYAFSNKDRSSFQTREASTKHDEDQLTHHIYTDTSSPSDITKDTEPLVAPSGEQGSTLTPFTGRDFLSLDPKGRIEMKGTTFLAKSPLDSDPTPYDVYYSDKLNFLQRYN